MSASKGLILAEKPSLMRTIQAAYKSDKFSFDLDFVALHGHLMEMAEPAYYHQEWGKWKLEDLPILPDDFVYLPKDKESVSRILSKIKTGHYDFIVNACDAGREGELIFWSFYQANHLTLPVKRFWCSTTVETDLRTALHHLRDYSEPALANLKTSSEYRAIFDWLVGINFSRAVSLKTGKNSHIGRVVTPTLQMVVSREKEIRNFKSEDFYEVFVTLSKGSDSFPGVVLQPPNYKQSRFKVKAEADAVKASLCGTGTVVDVKKNLLTTKAPTLYSTLELQKDANRYFKFRAIKTDAIAQSLYEAGYISYPRTSCRFIPTSLVPEIPNLLKPLEQFPELADALKLVTPATIKATTTGKSYVDNSKLTDHHAIIPTTAVFDPSTLTSDQVKIYLLVAKRFLSIFLPPYKTESTTILTNCNGNLVHSSGRVIIDKGFSMLYADHSKEVVLPTVEKSDILTLSKPAIKAGQTKAPNRYTDKTLLDAMANAGKMVSAAEQRAILKECSGIGTEATRSGILDKLEKTGMVQVDKGFFVPTDYGMDLIDAIGERDICSPVMTADWEAKLRDLEENGHPKILWDKMIDYVKTETKDIVSKVSADLNKYRFLTIGSCPICGKPVFIGKNYYLCSNYKGEKDPCSFVVAKQSNTGVKISDKDMKLLLAGKKTGNKTLKAKDGRSYIAPLYINEHGRVAPFIGSTNSTHNSAEKDKVAIKSGICKCPICGEPVNELNRYYACSHLHDGCEFIICKSICKADISIADVKNLCAGKSIGPKTFTWKSGKQGTAKLKGRLIKKDGVPTFKIEFEFDN